MPDAPPNRWRRRMDELLVAIAGTEVEGDRGLLWDEWAVCKTNAEAVEAEADTARRLTADVEAERGRLDAEAHS